MQRNFEKRSHLFVLHTFKELICKVSNEICLIGRPIKGITLCKCLSMTNIFQRFFKFHRDRVFKIIDVWLLQFLAIIVCFYHLMDAIDKAQFIRNVFRRDHKTLQISSFVVKNILLTPIHCVILSQVHA